MMNKKLRILLCSVFILAFSMASFANKKTLVLLFLQRWNLITVVPHGWKNLFRTSHSRDFKNSYIKRMLLAEASFLCMSLLFL